MDKTNGMTRGATRFVAFILTSLTLCISSVSANYYDSQTEKQFTNPKGFRDGELKDLIKKASGRNFRGLGYKTAKKHLFGKVDLREDSTSTFVIDVYCEKVVRRRTGPWRIPANNQMNTEHTWPQSKGSKREPARGDLHHLFPTDSPANSARGNHPFGEVKGEMATDSCDASMRGDIVNPTTGEPTRTTGFQPPKNHRGNVARAMFYVSARYGYRISDLEEYYLRKWHKEDPVDSAEIARNDAIEDSQGNRNPFIDFPQLVERISDL